MRNPNHWQYQGDANPQDYGGKWYRRVNVSTYQVIELTNMDDACGRDNDGCSTYVVELSLVDLSQIPAEVQKSALRSCGPDLTEYDAQLHEEITAIACYEYGAKAPLESWSGNNSTRMMRSARKLASELKRDQRELEERLQKPVNKIGSTAQEYMTGDIHSAVLRGVSEGREDAQLALRLALTLGGGQ